MATKAKASSKTTSKAKPAKSAAKPKAPAKAASPQPAPAAPLGPTPTATASKGAMYPIVDRSPWGILALVLGIFALGGVGTIIAGVVSKQNLVRDIVIGALQLVIPFLGWAWGLVWGILIFVKGNK